MVLKKTLESPLDCKEISPGISLEGMMLKLKLQYFGHLMQRVDSLEKTHAGKDWGQEEKGTTEDEMARWTFVGKVMSLLFNMLSRLVITFLPRSKRLLISWLQSASAVILEPPKIKSDTVSTVSPSISHEVMGPDAMIFIS